MTRDSHTRTRWPLPQRSQTDRKLGGVAGGLGRAWRVDPILIRVAFVVLTIFGGSGVLLYCAGWLLMRGDGDEVSAVEALAGRGRSSVSPALSVVLIVVGLASMGSVFSWGIPFWPVVVGAVVLTVLLGQRHRDPHAPRRDAGQWADNAAQRVAQWGADVGERAAKWGADLGERAGGWTDRHASQPQGPSTDPDDSAKAAAHGSKAGASPEAGGSPEAGASGKAAGFPQAASAYSPEASDTANTGNTAADPFSTERTPPAWDPLGAAPFAWDLPEPSPDPASYAPESDSRTDRVHGNAIGRVFLGLALIVGSVTTAGITARWWSLPWSAVAGITLSVLAVGLAITALRGRGSRALIGPGVFLAVLTLALSVSGLTGTSGFGRQHWLPESAASVASSYSWNAGDATLDLSTIEIPKGETVRTELTVRLGRATVIVPPDVAVSAECSATAGNVDCLGQRADGLRPQLSVDRAAGTVAPPALPAVPAVPAVPDAPDAETGNAGQLVITVHSNAGQVVLTSHE